MGDLKSLLLHHGTGSQVCWLVLFFVIMQHGRPMGMAERRSNTGVGKTGGGGRWKSRACGEAGTSELGRTGQDGGGETRLCLGVGWGGSALLAPQISGVSK